MLTDERLDQIRKSLRSLVPADLSFNNGFVSDLFDEIKRLRRTVEFQEQEIKMFLDSLQEAHEELARYQTPNVDNIEVKG